MERPNAAPWTARIPQEDFCQVLGRPSNEKYEAQGGPSMGQCLQVLRSSQTARADIRHFLCAQLAFWLLAATDGHGWAHLRRVATTAGQMAGGAARLGRAGRQLTR